MYHGSSLAVTAIGVFFNMVIERARSVMTFVDISRSLATDCKAMGGNSQRKRSDHSPRPVKTHSSELSGIHLDVLDVSLDFSSELVQVLDDGSLDSLCEVGMVVGDDTCLLSLLAEERKMLVSLYRVRLQEPLIRTIE